MCAPSPPPPPDYAAAARAQGGASLQAAIANNILNRPNETSPLGSRTWQQTGTAEIPAAEGNAAVSVPTYSVNTQLTPQGQALQDSSVRIAGGLAGAGERALQGVNASVSSPLANDFSGLPSNSRDAVADAMYRRQTRYLDPQFAQSQRDLETQLINKGFSQGGEAWNREMDNQAMRKQKAYSDAREYATTQGIQQGMAERNQAINEILLKRQQPLAELASLRTGAAPQMPQFQTYANTANAQPAPMFQAANAAGQYSTDVHNAEAAQSGGMMSGLFKLGAAAMPWILSDRRVKSNIIRIGTHPLGIGIYSYTIAGKPDIGVMADEVLDVMPEAVMLGDDGYFRVSYWRLNLG